MRGQSPREKPPLTGEVAAKQAGRALDVSGGGGVKTPPYGAKDKGAVMTRLRAGHARPLRNMVKWDVGRPAPRPPGRLAAMRSHAVCRCRGRRPRRPAEVARERVATQSPSKPLRPRKLGQLPTAWGAFFARAEPAQKASLVKGRCRAQARRRDSWPSTGVTGNSAKPVGIPQAANAASPL